MTKRNNYKYSKEQIIPRTQAFKDYLSKLLLEISPLHHKEIEK